MTEHDVAQQLAQGAIALGRGTYAKRIFAERGALHVCADGRGVVVDRYPQDLPMREVPAYDAPGPREILRINRGNPQFAAAGIDLPDGVSQYDADHRVAAATRFLQATGADYLYVTYPDGIRLRATRGDLNLTRIVRVPRRFRLGTRKLTHTIAYQRLALSAIAA